MTSFRKGCLLAAVAALLVAAAAPVRQSAWLGDWRLDRSRSGLAGPTLRIGRVPRGYSFDFGAARFEIGDDGRDYPTVPTRSTSLKALGPRSWLRQHKVNGKVVDRSRLLITPDQRLLVIESVAVAPDGRTRASRETLRRLAGGRGLAGTWRSTAAGADVPDRIVISDAGGGRLRLEYPGEGQFYVLEPGGPPASLGGARAVPGVTMALQPVSAARLRWTEFVGGKPYRLGVDRLLLNGRFLEETSWPAIAPSERQRAVYARH